MIIISTSRQRRHALVRASESKRSLSHHATPKTHTRAPTGRRFSKNKGRARFRAHKSHSVFLTHYRLPRSPPPPSLSLCYLFWRVWISGKRWRAKNRRNLPRYFPVTLGIGGANIRIIKRQLYERHICPTSVWGVGGGDGGDDC